VDVAVVKIGALGTVAYGLVEVAWFGLLVAGALATSGWGVAGAERMVALLVLANAALHAAAAVAVAGGAWRASGIVAAVLTPIVYVAAALPAVIFGFGFTAVVFDR
jgi:hypothetical protein